MLTLQQFKAMAECYGSDLQRWPEDLRDAAASLRENSPQARAILAEARRIDIAIETAGAEAEAALWQAGDPLARLRGRVATEISSGAPRRETAIVGRGALPWQLAWAHAPRLGWLGLTGSAGAAIVAGLLIGATLSAPARSGGLLAMLQPAPIEILAD